MCIRSPNKKCQFSHKWLDQCWLHFNHL
jgi:hypothetical protein